MAIPRIKNYSMPEIKDITNKVEWQLRPEKSVLLIHDMQNYFIDFYDKDSELIHVLLNHIEQLKTLCDSLDIPVIYTAQPPNQDPLDRALLTDFWGPGLSDTTYAPKIVGRIKPEKHHHCLSKWRYSAFQKTSLQHFMESHERDQLIICGVYAHIGILTTALEAFMMDIQPFLVGDAIADFTQEEHQWALSYTSQRCGKVESFASVQRALKPLAVPEKQDVDKASTALHLDMIKQDIADALQLSVTSIEDGDNVIDLGLDSVRLMQLIDKWRQQGSDVHFSDLAETAVISEWLPMLNKHATV